MNVIRRSALSLWMLALASGPLLLTGCNDGYDKQPLVTIDSPEMQELQRQAELEEARNAEQEREKKEAALDLNTENTVALAEQGDTTEKQVSPAAEVETPATDKKPAQAAPSDVATTVAVKPAVFPGDAEPEAAPKKPLEVKLLVPEKKFQPEGPDNALRVSYDDLDLLKVLNMDPVSLDAAEKMPDWLKGLDGKRIRLRGFMYPPDSETGISVFVLARDNQICCFGRNPKPYDVIHILMRKGETVDYILGRPFDVVGNFHIEMLTYDDKKVDGLYYLDDAVVIDQ